MTWPVNLIPLSCWHCVCRLQGQGQGADDGLQHPAAAYIGVGYPFSQLLSAGPLLPPFVQPMAADGNSVHALSSTSTSYTSDEEQQPQQQPSGAAASQASQFQVLR